MKHKSKFLAVLLAVAFLIAVLSLTLVACGEPDHRHRYMFVGAKSPTCTEDGNIQYYICKCGKFFDGDKQEIEESQTVIPATGHDKVTTSWESDGTSHWHKCNNCDAKFDLASHMTADEWIEDSEASCTAKGHHHKECEVCGYHMVEEDYGEMLPHEWEENLTADNHKKCSICGTEETLYEERDGKIYFGEYPQTKETDNGITATLAQMSGNRPVRGNSGEWTDYGYYINGSTSEYMWYIDLEYGGERYRGVYFTSYRPYYTTNSSSTGNSNQDDNGYYTNTLYWFKWEPIEWRVLERTDGEAFLMSNVILDSQQYYRTTSGTRSIDGKTVYPNNYKESDIRAWLNGTFYNWAFDEFEQVIINETLVDNSASTTSSSSNSYACENTNDKVFLLSYKDVLNTSYGFNLSSGNYDTARRLKTTGYAQSQGADTLTNSSYRGNGMWWLRSPLDYDSSRALSVNGDGNADCNDYVNYTSTGVVPALRITLLY